MTNGFDEFQNTGREGVERAVQSFGALSRSWQELAGETAGYSKQALEDGAAHFERMLGAQSLDVAVKAQTEFVKSSYEKALGQAARFGELYLDIVKEAGKPFEGMIGTTAK